MCVERNEVFDESQAMKKDFEEKGVNGMSRRKNEEFFVVESRRGHMCRETCEMSLPKTDDSQRYMMQLGNRI